MIASEEAVSEAIAKLKSRLNVESKVNIVFFITLDIANFLFL
jgi:hypothetical protein